MTKEQLAARLNGREYPFELTKDETKEAKESGLVVLYGASDDLAEFKGAIRDECGASDNRRPILLRKSGPFTPPDRDEAEVLEKFGVLKHVNQSATKIVPIWDRDDISWQYETDLPHAPFDVLEDGEIYCRGIVFNLADVAD